jgi:hypothetical protein
VKSCYDRFDDLNFIREYLGLGIRPDNAPALNLKRWEIKFIHEFNFNKSESDCQEIIPVQAVAVSYALNCNP